MRRWPEEANHPIVAKLPALPNVPGASKAFRTTPGRGLPVTKAVLRINGKELESKSVSASDTQISFTAKLTKGSHQLSPTFILENGKEVGAFFAVVTKK